MGGWGFLVQVENGKITNIEGDRDSRLSGGAISKWAI
jgi:hypothetical protein